MLAIPMLVIPMLVIPALAFSTLAVSALAPVLTRNRVYSTTHIHPAEYEKGYLCA